jgi:hypothetical protein
MGVEAPTPVVEETPKVAATKPAATAAPKKAKK